MAMLDCREFTIDQRLLSVRNTYVVRNRVGDQLGFIKQEFLSWGPKFWLEGNNGERLGEVDGKVLTIHNEYEIKDRDGQTRAKIKKKIMKLFGSQWWMEDLDGHEMARIDGNVVHHTYDIISPDKTGIARVHLKWAAVSDEYCVEILRKDFDPLLILGYAVAMDHVEHKERSPISPRSRGIGRLFGR